MIHINLTKENEVLKPEIELTAEELSTVTSSVMNGGTMVATYYQGDEPIIIQDNETE